MASELNLEKLETWEDVINKVKIDDKGKIDLKTNYSAVEMVALDEGTQVKHEDKLYTLTDFAEKQICGRLRIPHEYYRRCPANLRQNNLDHWHQGMQERDLLLRTKNDTARAFLTHRYSVINNVDVVNNLSQMQPDGRFQSIEITDIAMHLRQVNAQSLEIQKNDICNGGLYVGNSEVGHSTCSLSIYILRLICTNGLIGLVKTPLYRQVHLGIDKNANEYFAKMNIAINESAKYIDEVLNLMKDSTNQTMTYQEAFEVAKRLDISEELESFNEKRKDKQEVKVYDFINFLTDDAKSYSGNRRLEQESEAGRLLERAA